MQTAQKKILTVLAPAKINLYLHITGRRDDGFHMLDSLVVFADVGDKISLKPSRAFSFSIDGPYARAFKSSERDIGDASGNLVVKAARRLAKAVNRDLMVNIRLTKNLPLAAGIGGGSSDAAATIWALLKWWNIEPRDVPDFDVLLLSLGADVPACMACTSVKVGGVGELIDPVPGVSEIPVVLVNSRNHCPTTDVFSRYDGSFGAPVFATVPVLKQDFIAFLKEQHNDLLEAAIGLVPNISKVLEILEVQQGCVLARMSGSGATCFGLFDNELESLDAAEQISRENPDWWVRAGVLNRGQRY